MRRTSACQPPLAGGLGVVDITSKIQSLLTMWVKRFLVGGPHPWKYFFRFCLRTAFLSEPVERVFTFPTIGPASLRALPLFYRSMMSAWASLTVAKDAIGWKISLSPSSLVDLEHLSSSMVYRELRDAKTPDHRCVQRAPRVEWRSVWSKLQVLRH